MKKINILIAVFTFFVLILGSTTTAVRAKTEVIPQNQFPSLMERAFLRSLDGTILDIMRKHGDNQLFEYGRIEKISGNDQYNVTIRVIGFRRGA